MDAALVYAEPSLPTTLNPLFARTLVDFRLQSLVFDALVFRNPHTGLYQSRILRADDDGLPTYEEPDPLTVVVHLRDGIRWHDGERLTGEDVCFTIAAMMDPGTPSPVANTVRSALTGCEARGNDVSIHLARPLRAPLLALDFHVLPQHAFEGTAISPDLDFASHPIGTGSMSAVRGRRDVVFTAYDNPHHRAQIRQLTVSAAGDPVVTVQRLLGGQLDGVADVSPVLVTGLGFDASGALRMSPADGFLFVALNTTRGPLADVRVRQALDLLVDRTALQDLAGVPVPVAARPTRLSGPYLPTSSCHEPSLVPRTTSDRDAAKALLQAAGATWEDGRWMWNGAPITLQIGISEALVVDTNDLQHPLEHQLVEAGFTTTAYRVTQDDWARKAVTGQLTGFDLLIGKWSFVRDPDDVSALFHTRTTSGQGSLNLFNASDPQTDALLEQYDDAPNDTDAASACRAVHARIAADVPYLFLWTTHTYSAWRSELAGPTGWTYDAFWNFDEWHLVEAPPPPP